MSFSTTHRFQSAQPDDPAQPGLVQPSNWNDDHLTEQTAPGAIGRTDAGAGPSRVVGWAEVRRTPVAIVATATFNPALADENSFIRCTNAGGCVIELPSDSAVAFPIGTAITFSQANATSLTFNAGSGATVNVPATHLASTNTQHSVVQAFKVAANTWVLFGNLRLA